MNDLPKPPRSGEPLALVGVSACRRIVDTHFPGHWTAERYLRAVEGATAGGSAGLRGAAAGFLLLVVLAGGFVQQRQNFLSLHSDLVDGGRPER